MQPLKCKQTLNEPREFQRSLIVLNNSILLRGEHCSKISCKNSVTCGIIQKGNVNIYIRMKLSFSNDLAMALTLADVIVLMSKNFSSNKRISHPGVCRSKSSTIAFAIANVIKTL